MRQKLLLAESDPIWMGQIRKQAMSDGYEVACANSALECVSKMRDGLPDVLVLSMDILWGGGDGVLDWLRTKYGVISGPVLLTVNLPATMPGGGQVRAFLGPSRDARDEFLGHYSSAYCRSYVSAAELMHGVRAASKIHWTMINRPRQKNLKEFSRTVAVRR